MAANRQVDAREYLRVSLDRSGRERSIIEQQEDDRRAWPDWKFGEPYSDVSISASRYSRKARGGYAELIADIAAGRFGATHLVLWEASRGSRRVGEWVDLIEACEAQLIRIAVTTHGRVYDPGNGRDRRSLLEDAVDSEYESYKVSMRTRRSAAANAAEGRPNGGVPFGYRRRYDPQTRQMVAQEPEPEEAKIVVELFHRVAQGHSLRSIARDFEARGVRTRSKIVFTDQHLRSMLSRPLYIGERHHAPGGYRAAKAKGAPVRVTAAIWPAIIDKRTWLIVQRILSDPSRNKQRPGRANNLSSMIARCDVCGGPMCAFYPRNRNGGREYRCQKGGHARVDADELDALAEDVVCTYLSRPDNVAWLTEGNGHDTALTEVRDELVSIRAELDDLGDKVGRGELSATLAARAEPAILKRLKAAETREAELSTPVALAGLLAPGRDVRRRWKAAELTTKREVLRLLLVPDVLGELRVTPRPKGWVGFEHMPVADRVVWRRD